MTKEQKNNFKDFIKWFSEEPDGQYTQKRFQADCGSPACVCGHMAFHAKYKLNKFASRTLAFDQFSMSEIYGILVENWHEIYNYGSEKFEHPISKNEALKMLDHLLFTNGEEVRWRF